MTSMPEACAAATSARLVEPVSTVMMRRCPAWLARVTAAMESPWPSAVRCGTYGSAVMPSQRRASTTMVSPVRPSASKSPSTRTDSPARRACAMRATTTSASGSRPGSWRPASGASKREASSAGSTGPRRDSTRRARAERPRRRASSMVAWLSGWAAGTIQWKWDVRPVICRQSGPPASRRLRPRLPWPCPPCPGPGAWPCAGHPTGASRGTAARPRTPTSTCRS